MKEASKQTLRRQVLESRGELRGYIKELTTAKKEVTRIESQITQVVEEIRDMQLDCGDPIQIDPQYPEIQ